MQNHRNKIKYPVLAGIALTGLATFYPVSAVSQDDAVPVSVTAAQAREHPTEEVMTLAGGFSVEGTDWSAAGEDSELHGPMDRPVLIVLSGAPARVVIRNPGQRDNTLLTAEAQHIRYEREAELISLRGNATLKYNDDLLSGDEIDYNLNTDEYRAGGAGGVELTTPPRQ